MSNWAYAQNVPTDTWRSAMIIPRSLHLIKTGQIFRLASRPAEELKKLRKKSFEIPEKTLKGTKKLDVPFPITPSEITLSLDMMQSQNFEIVLSNTKNQLLLFGFDRNQNKFYVDRSLSGKKDFSDVFARKYFAPRFSQNETLYMQIFIDAASIEVFADQGQVVMTEIFFPDSDFQELSLNAQGEVKLTKGIIHRLQGIWK